MAVRGLAVAVLALLAASGCGGGDDDDQAGARSDAPETTTTIESTTTPTTTTGPTTTTPPDATTATTEPGGGTVGAPGLPPQPPPSEPIRVGGGVATGLAADPRCDPADPATALVTLSWQPAGSGEQLVAVSTRQDGFDTGTYASSETLAPDRSSYQLRDSQPGGLYYWRVLTRQGDGWAASDTATFEGPTCVSF
ncbi:MAG: hypothetical protein ACRD0G_06690 [Acidimicrobiales bacterium]